MSLGELIELEELDERIELTDSFLPRTPRLERVNALRISPGKFPEILNRVRIIRLVGDTMKFPQLVEETGEGHDFHPCSHAQPTWCDLCGDFIWGVYKQSLRCANCRFTCHYRCRALIKLNCNQGDVSTIDQSSDVRDSIETDTNVDEVTESKKQELSNSELQQKIKEYNAQINSNLFMSLNKDGTYNGFIKVHLKLVRPVSVPPPRKGTASQEQAKGKRGGAVKRRTSFYLPKDTAKHLHISSRTRAQEVIQALLKKFTVIDNPAKFALFERTERHDQVYLRKLPDDECPLFLRLCAGPNEKAMSLVLKENETGEVNWDAFSLPELQNFMRILKREEEEHVKQIMQRYALAHDRIQQALVSTNPG
ncbi:ras association domain-containing protein 1-like isoform X1 [Tachysurus fulvidraco]|uniref:ras association domain-containing protein 1-like isoform X1 n=1 Tax=Tachysurus fulvidraco TaxID=1234273 RepID=UPI000F4DF988|nr:ras association domain-containing protein 1-like isoform X1 [Tachysurus fulvidraco]